MTRRYEKFQTKNKSLGCLNNLPSLAPARSLHASTHAQSKTKHTNTNIEDTDVDAPMLN